MTFVKRGFRFPGGDSVQTVSLSGERTTVTVTDTSSAEAELPAGSSIVYVRSTVDIWIRFGNTGVDAADASDNCVLFPAGESVVMVPLDGSQVPYDFVRVIRAGSVDGVAQFERIETL